MFSLSFSFLPTYSVNSLLLGEINSQELQFTGSADIKFPPILRLLVSRLPTNNMRDLNIKIIYVSKRKLLKKAIVVTTLRFPNFNIEEVSIYWISNIMYYSFEISVEIEYCSFRRIFGYNISWNRRITGNLISLIWSDCWKSNIAHIDKSFDIELYLKVAGNQISWIYRSYQKYTSIYIFDL